MESYFIFLSINAKYFLNTFRQPMTEDDEFDVDDVYEEGITPNKNDTPVPAVPPVPVVPERNPRRGNLPGIVYTTNFI